MNLAMKTIHRLALLLALSGIPAVAQLATPERLEQLRHLYPEADANKDGTLTEEEARLLHQAAPRETRPRLARAAPHGGRCALRPA